MTDKTTRGAAHVLPRKFALIIEESPLGGWYVTSDAHKGFLHLIHPDEGLPEGLRGGLAGLRQLLVAQVDADNERAKKASDV